VSVTVFSVTAQLAPNTTHPFDPENACVCERACVALELALLCETNARWCANVVCVCVSECTSACACVCECVSVRQRVHVCGVYVCV
jgi:hypothetical protein